MILMCPDHDIMLMMIESRYDDDNDDRPDHGVTQRLDGMIIQYILNNGGFSKIRNYNLFVVISVIF